MSVWYKITEVCRNIIACFVGIIVGVWIWHLLGRYSYNELIVKFNKMSKFSKKLFEYTLGMMLFPGEDADDKACERIDAGIQNTLGLSNTVDLYNYAKNYNETHSEDAA